MGAQDTFRVESENFNMLFFKVFNKNFITHEYISWLNDKKLMRYSRHHKTMFNKNHCLEYLNSFENTNNIFWAIISKETNSMIGTMTIYFSDDLISADLGILIGSSNARGKGNGRIAWGLAMKQVFAENPCKIITAGANIKNLAMIKIFKYFKMKNYKKPENQIIRYQISKEKFENLEDL